MSLVRRIWARVEAFFIRSAPLPPERFELPAPAAAEEAEAKFGPFQKLEAEESTHVIGIRNKKMTGRTSATHPPRKGSRPLTQDTELLANRRREEDLSDRTQHRRALHEGPPMLECFACGELFPAEDIADHPCEGKHSPDRMLDRWQGGGSASFDKALSNVVYLDPKLEAGRKK